MFLLQGALPSTNMHGLGILGGRLVGWLALVFGSKAIGESRRRIHLEPTMTTPVGVVTLLDASCLCLK
jgi:hypothetical protein